MAGGWIDHPGPDPNPAAFYKNDGIVHLRGLISQTSFSLGIFQLPPGYRPQFRQRFVVASLEGGTSRVEILPNGEVVQPDDGRQLRGAISLDGITFRAAPQ